MSRRDERKRKRLTQTSYELQRRSTSDWVVAGVCLFLELCVRRIRFSVELQDGMVPLIIIIQKAGK